MKTVLMKTINETLIRYASSSTNIGLLNGKMGVALYAFHAARKYQNFALHGLAEKMIDDVVKQLETTEMKNNGFEDGLTGIIYGLEYLTREGFISSDDKNFLQDLDDRIFNAIINHAETMPIDLTGIVGCLFYLYPKIRYGDTGSADLRYNKRLAIELINTLYLKIDLVEKQFSEPLSFNILWNLPLILLSLGRINELHIYDTKISRIVEHLAPNIITLFPRIHANRLHLLLAMKVLRILSIRGWQEHISLLEKNISMNKILNEELKNRAISVKNGISGISLICTQLSLFDSHNPFKIMPEELEKKILDSEYWNFHIDDNLGILYGNAGMGLALLIN